MKLVEGASHEGRALAERPAPPFMIEGVSSILLERLARIEQALSLLRHPLPPPALKPSQVAGLLKVSERTVKGYIERGELVASSLTLGNGVRVYRVMPRDLEAFMNGRTSRSEAQPIPAGKQLRVPRNLI